MAQAEDYDSGFFKKYEQTMASSAQVLVPLVVELLKPSSVVDVGCGEGVWLAEFLEHGVDQIAGLDGDYVATDRLRIPPSCFHAVDLSKSFELDREFSLVVSLEVAEHLPPSVASNFVDRLTRLGKVILFSAAIPSQGGTNHINLQWQDYWANLFSERGYRAIDAFRPSIWNDDRVSFWYRQNVLLYVEENHLETESALQPLAARSGRQILSIVHPEFSEILARGGPNPEQLDQLTLGQTIPRLPRMVLASIRKRTGL